MIPSLTRGLRPLRPGLAIPIPIPFPQLTRPLTAAATRASVPWPLVTEVSSEGWRTHDIFSKLLQERIVCLSGSIDDTLSISIVTQLLWLESDNPEKPITMYINSPGGSVTSGLAIYDTMEYITAPVSTVCIGAASSMAALLLTGGAAGKRFALPHSSIMIHQPLGGTQGQASDILIYATQIQRIRDQVNHIYRKHLNRAFGHEKYDLDAMNEVMERDKYLTAEEAKAYGIIDEILGKRSSVVTAQEEKGKGQGSGDSGGDGNGSGNGASAKSAAPGPNKSRNESKKDGKQGGGQGKREKETGELETETKDDPQIE